MRSTATLAFDIVRNLLGKRYQLVYIVENAPWSIRQDGCEITSRLTSLGLCDATVRVTPRGLRNTLIHFGSFHSYTQSVAQKAVDVFSNTLVLTWFHVEDDVVARRHIPYINTHIKRVVTSCTNTREHLLRLGLRKDIVEVIPIGVDISHFSPVSQETKQLIRERLGISLNVCVIGCFQKDGNYWGHGLEPKYIKGPDVFCDALDMVAKERNIFVLLTGPSRGYVKQRLQRSGIPFFHTYVSEYCRIVPYYQALDLYVVPSRLEGGPKAILESWATGVPVVTTNVGMVPDICQHAVNAVICDVDDPHGLAQGILSVAHDKNFSDQLARNGFAAVPLYDWNCIVRQYYETVYRLLLNKEKK
ncbi:MAG: hypothetical protein A3J66_03110 [Candidatus Magasanikbacteria bacterium RIFCSPHIGHO2_02_FULL_47_14]|uniref:Glycosyl transferase family 1 domain-containing protein n=1 Tax=Candidatus Magasanikbacteria bacterium RIFCSPHIGHO2_02_FULL_47_14 TaxID=1798680 RepID=A0A1F6MAA0_9BACT|nr:MAG: hypothetical protein A3J66_03110 [Candidatus Magasanikbacteria bacterium RIFCSPHIGHO2_02_FULL_47_14]